MTEQAITKVPEPLSPRPFNVPRSTESVLPNGLRVVVLKDPKLPLISIRLIVMSGDAYEPNEFPGLNSAMASMLTEGTEAYTSRALAEEVERLGASLTSGSGSDNTRISASCLSPYLSDMLRLMQEVVLKPSFPQGELDLYKQNTIEGLKFQRSQAGFLATEQVARIIYGDHPYSRVSPAPEDIERIDRDELVRQHSRTMIPNNSVMVVVGDIDPEQLIGEINERFGSWERGPIVSPRVSPVPKRDRRTLTIVDRKGSAQANIVLALPAITRNHPDFFPVLVMNQILGAGASSRIFMNLREEKGYTYGAYSKFDMKRLGGEFEATAEVRTSVVGESLKEFFYELERIRTETVSEEELRDAINYLTGVFPIRAETQEGLTNLIVQQKIFGLSDDYLVTYRDRVAEVSVADVILVAEKYVRPDEIAMVIVGDGESIISQVGDFAEAIEAFDTDGNAIDPADLSKGGSEAAADFSGVWELSVDFQGQKVPATLRIEQAEGLLNGVLESMLGETLVNDGKVTGRSFEATAVTEAMGQKLELILAGRLDEERLSGTISVPMMADPIVFEGKRG